MSFAPVLLDSINYLKSEHADHVVVAGSHGGRYCAAKAAAGHVRGIILHDAGVGLDHAGVAVLDFCQPYLIPSAVVDSDTALIGDAAHTYRHGLISGCNEEARRLGVHPGMSCAGAAALLSQADPHWDMVETVQEHRHEIRLAPDREAVICIDSASLIQPGDQGRIVITGSHGGLIGGNPAKAINVPACFLAFNDAGFGFQNAGAGRLVPLDARAIPAVLVAAASARIGDGRSTLLDGRISAVNATAEAEGFLPGTLMREALLDWKKR